MNSNKKDIIDPDTRALIRKLSINCVDEDLFEEILTTLLLRADEHKDQCHGFNAGVLHSFEELNPQSLMPLLKVMTAHVREAFRLAN